MQLELDNDKLVHCESEKKQRTWHLIKASANVDRVSKFWYYDQESSVLFFWLTLYIWTYVSLFTKTTVQLVCCNKPTIASADTETTAYYWW